MSQEPDDAIATAYGSEHVPVGVAMPKHWARLAHQGANLAAIFSIGVFHKCRLQP